MPTRIHRLAVQFLHLHDNVWGCSELVDGNKPNWLSKIHIARGRKFYADAPPGESFCRNEKVSCQALDFMSSYGQG